MACRMACPEIEKIFVSEIFLVKNILVENIFDKKVGRNESVLDLSVDLRNAKKESTYAIKKIVGRDPKKWKWDRNIYTSTITTPLSFFLSPQKGHYQVSTNH